MTAPAAFYDPASARIAAEAVLSMSRKLADLGDGTDLATNNTRSRYISIKEQQAELAKHELNVLWTDYFKAEHLEAHLRLWETFWKAAKLCSQTKVEGSIAAGEELLKAIEEIHDIYWASKDRSDVPFYLAG